MKKAVALLLVAVFACAMLAGCSNNTEVDPILEESASPSPSATASAFPPPTPTVDPNAAGEGVPTPRVDEAVTVEVIDAGFDELYKASPYVVIGHLTKSLGEWNSVRETDGSASQDTFNMEKQYTLVVTEVLKGEDIKANDSITYSLPYRNKYADESEYTMLAFQEPPLNQEMLFFLGKDVVTNLKTKEVIATVYYPASEPHSFLIEKDTLFTFGNSADLAAEFANGDGAEGKGISLASARQEMGLSN